MTPFELFEQDTDEVIMLINYYIQKGNNAPQPEEQPPASERERDRSQFWDLI